MGSRSWGGGALGLLLLGMSVVAGAAPESPSLPEPLTLEYALSLTDAEGAPEWDQLQVLELKQRADESALRAQTGLRVNLSGRLRWVDPIRDNPDTPLDDHLVSLQLRKAIYDFGQSRAAGAATAAEQQALELQRLQIRWLRRQQIMQHYLDVLLADLQSGRNEESMTMAFLRFDKLRERQLLGQASDIDLLELETHFRKEMSIRSRGQSDQRLKRARLARALNRPGQLSSILTTPELPRIGQSLPELALILERVRSDNPALRASALRLQAAQHRVAGARRGAWPRIEAELNVGDNSRVTGTSDRWQAGVNISIPLYEGGGERASLLKAQSELYHLQSQHDELQVDLEQQTLESWLRLQELKQQQLEANTNLDYRELYLDRSRANYELEFQADLGDSMVRIAEAQQQQSQVRFEIALEWERLAALTNGAIDQIVNAMSASNATQ